VLAWEKRRVFAPSFGDSSAQGQGKGKARARPTAGIPGPSYLGRTADLFCCASRHPDNDMNATLVSL
jgi:hypothetical protein